MEIECYSCDRTIGHFRVLDGYNVSNVPVELQFIWCEKCKNEEIKDRKNVDALIRKEEEAEVKKSK